MPILLEHEWGTEYPKLFNYNDILINQNNIALFHLINNITENINGYLNNKLKKAICSNGNINLNKKNLYY